MARLSRAIVLAITVGVSLCGGTAARSDGIHTIALSGQHAPGTLADVRFDGFDTPQLKSDGQVVFAAGLAGEGIGCTYRGKVCNYGGLWSGDAGSLVLVMRGGDPAPGLPSGVRFATVNEPNLTVSSNGPLALQAGAYAPDGTGYGGIWSGTGGSLSLVLLAGDHAPGTPPDYVIWGFDGPGHFMINSSGQSVL